tara:strand:+ start:117 stop:275 length:159 start_codon:yes stop_codon:yes gene_type:complete
MIEQLEEEHRKLDEEIKRVEGEYSSWSYLSTHITELKKRKLLLKDKIKKLRS